MRKALYHYIDRAVVTRKVEERMNWSASFIIHCKYLKGLRDCEGKVCGVYREGIRGIERKKTYYENRETPTFTGIACNYHCTCQSRQMPMIVARNLFYIEGGGNLKQLHVAGSWHRYQ